MLVVQSLVDLRQREEAVAVGVSSFSRADLLCLSFPTGSLAASALQSGQGAWPFRVQMEAGQLW